MEESLTRRGFLRNAASVGSVAGVASLAGCMGFDGGASLGESSPTARQQQQSVGAGDVTPAIDPSTVEHRFDDVVNLVENYGADPTGEESINDSLDAAWSDDTLIVFPEGEYKMNRKCRQTTSSNVGLIGQNAIIRHGEVEAINGHLVIQGEYTGGTMMFRLGTPSNAHGDLLFGGFIFDWSWSENAGMQALNAFIEGTGEIRNIAFTGTHSLGTHGNMRVAAGSPESVVLVDSIDMSGGGMHYADTINTRSTRRFGGHVPGLSFGQSWSTTGMTGHPDQQGTTVFRNVLTGPWPDNAIYVRGGSGRKIVSSCAAANGGGSQIRTNGGDEWEPIEWLDGTESKQEALEGPYPGSVVEDSVAVIDRQAEGVYINPRGILLQDGPQVVRNCEVVIGWAEGGGAGGTYGIGTRGEGGAAPAGPVTVENTTITLHEDTDAVYVSPYTNAINVRDVAIETVGWEAGLDHLLGGVGVDQAQGVTVNGDRQR